jgi:uncharacterized Zn finger protein (UPF0148 family)
MRLEKCPRCGNPVVKTDLVCISCGLDLLEAERKLSAQAAAEAAKAEKRPQATAKNPAASGVATDVGQDTRLHMYDHFYAEKLTKERQSTAAMAAIAGGVGILLLCIAAGFLGRTGGLGRMIHAVLPATLQAEGWGAWLDDGFLTVIVFGLGIAGILLGIGQMQRTKLMADAIEDVKFGGRPTVVAIPSATVAGLLIASFLVPPVGWVVGIIFKLSDDTDTRDVGTRMIIAATLAVALFVVNWLWGLATQLKNAPTAVAPRLPGE